MDNTEYVTQTDASGTFHVQPHPEKRDRLLLTYVTVGGVEKHPIHINFASSKPCLVIKDFHGRKEITASTLSELIALLNDKNPVLESPKFARNARSGQARPVPGKPSTVPLPAKPAWSPSTEKSSPTQDKPTRPSPPISSEKKPPSPSPSPPTAKPTPDRSTPTPTPSIKQSNPKPPGSESSGFRQSGSLGGSTNRNSWTPTTPPPTSQGRNSATPTTALPPQQQNLLVGIQCNNFFKLWDNARLKKKKNKTPISFFRVEPPEGYFRIGDMAESTHGQYPNGSMIVVKESAASSSQPLLSPPLKYVRVWDDHGTGSKFGDLKVLRPVAPAGYLALGDVAWPSHHDDPPLEYMRCVHARASGLSLKYGTTKALVVTYPLSLHFLLVPVDLNILFPQGAKNGDLAVWSPVPDPSAGGSATNTFVTTSNYQVPKPHERPAWVLLGSRS